MSRGVYENILTSILRTFPMRSRFAEGLVPQAHACQRLRYVHLSVTTHIRINSDQMPISEGTSAMENSDATYKLSAFLPGG